MPADLKPIIYGEKKDINFAKFSINDLQAAIMEDLVGKGKQVQGVRIANGWIALTKYHSERSSTDLPNPYLQAGVVKGTLVLVVRSKTKASYEGMDVLIKDYDKLKAKLAAESVSVTNMEPDDAVIVGSAAALRNRHNLAPNDDPNYGEITGDIILDAHGENALSHSGRVIGKRMGMKTPAEIVSLLTTNKDAKKRIGKNFDGTLKLVACFTAAGGPEAQNADQPFAQKVLQLFRSKGYAKISVVGYPGMVAVARGDSTDSHGTATREGDTSTWTNQASGASEQEATRLEAVVTRALQTHNAKVEVTNAALQTRDDALAHAQDGIAKSGKSQADYLKTDEGKARLKTYNDAKAAYDKHKQQLAALRADYDKAKKAMKDSGLNDRLAHVEGRFGLQTLN